MTELQAAELLALAGQIYEGIYILIGVSLAVIFSSIFRYL